MKKSTNIFKADIAKWLEGESSMTDQEIQQSEEAILRFAAAHAMAPGNGMKEKIMEKIKALNSFQNNRQELKLDHLPLLDASSNWLDWQEVVKEISLPAEFDGIHLHMLENSDERELYVAWVKEYIEEEVHTDIIESFVLLEGTCECRIADANGNARIVRMGVGDFITMLPGETHDVTITSLEPAKAILQWMKLSA
ncbi:MAG: hypothetical protein ABIQ02_09190 [Saprospiraceae bacterium]